MHIDQLQGPVPLLQAIVRFPAVPTSEAWWRSYQRRMVATAGLESYSTAYRLQVRKDGSVDRLFSAVFNPGKAAAARRFFGGMVFLEAFTEDSVVFPDNAGEFRSWADDFPPLRHHIMPPNSLLDDGIWLACNFRIADQLDALIREAQSFGFGFGYQIHFRPFSANADRQRRVGRNVIALEQRPGVPQEIIDDQQRQSIRLRSATLLVEEIIATDGTDAADWLAEAIGRAFRAIPARARLQPRPLKFDDDDSDPAMMMHSSLLYDDWKDDYLFCSQAEDESFRGRVLSYRPAVELAHGRRGGAGVTKHDVPDPPNTPRPPNLSLFEGQGHIFISYRRLDLPRIAPILEWLDTRSLPLWFDRGISAGEEWDAVLERKINDAGMVLFFLSQSAADSKYCRREIKLADHLNKPLLVVKLEVTHLPDGLRFLSLLQQINMRDPEFQALLDSAIRRLLDSLPSPRS